VCVVCFCEGPRNRFASHPNQQSKYHEAFNYVMPMPSSLSHSLSCNITEDLSDFQLTKKGTTCKLIEQSSSLYFVTFSLLRNEPPQKLKGYIITNSAYYISVTPIPITFLYFMRTFPRNIITFISIHHLFSARIKITRWNDYVFNLDLSFQKSLFRILSYGSIETVCRYACLHSL